MAVRILAVLAAFAILYGCGQASSSVEKHGKKLGEEHADRTEASQPPPDPTQSSSSAEGGVSVGKVIAQAELEPVDDSGTNGTAVLKEVGDLGVQVELDVSGLAKKDPDAAYYAQAHEGSCSDKRTTGEEHEGEHGAGSGPPLALVRFTQLVAKAQRLEAHGGHEHIPKVPAGSIEQPISFGASTDGTSSVTSLLEGVEAKRLTSGGPEYVDLHAVGSEDASELACGDLVVASRSLG